MNIVIFLALFSHLVPQIIVNSQQTATTNGAAPGGSAAGNAIAAGSSFPSNINVDTGIIGHKIPFLDGNNTHSGTNLVTGTVNPSGGGVINSNQVNGATIPVSACSYTNSTSQIVTGNCVNLHAMTGATQDLRIIAARAVLGSNGGVIDGTLETGAQTWPACPTWGTAPYVFVRSPGTITVAANCTIPATVTQRPAVASLMDVASGFTVTDNSSWDASYYQQVIASGVNTDLLNHGKIVGQISSTHVGWWGADASGTSDSAVAVNAASYFLHSNGATNANGGTVHLDGRQYLLSSTNYQPLLPQDDGSYGTPVGGSGATFTSTISGGTVTGCSVSAGGNGYPFNATMLLVFSWADVQQGSGVTGTTTTDGTGVVNSCTITNSGVGVFVAPTINISVQGGDGVVLATSLSGGAIILPTITSGGHGFPISTSGIAAGIFGLTCTTQPAISVTSNASGVIVSIQQTSLGVGCTGTPVAVVGNSCAGTQCANIVPETSQILPCAVRTYLGVNYQGESELGTTITTNWDVTTVNNSQLAAFCVPDLFGNTLVGFSNLFFQHVFIGLYSDISTPGISTSRIHDVRFLNVAMPLVARVAQQGFDVDHVWNESQAGFAIGGFWYTRDARSRQDDGGYADKTHWTSNIYQPGGSGTYPTLDQNIDKWYETNIWKSQNGPFTGSLLPNGQCFVTTSTASPRITDFNYGQSGGSNSQTMCYQGIIGWAYTFLSRNSRLSHEVHISDSTSQCPIRGFLNGYLTGVLDVNNVESGGNIGGACQGPAWTADPYLPTSSKQIALYVDASFAVNAPSLVIHGLEIGSSYIQSIKAYSGASDLTQSQVDWRGLIEDAVFTNPFASLNSTGTSYTDANLTPIYPAPAFNGQKNSPFLKMSGSCSNNVTSLTCGQFFRTVPTPAVTNPDVTLTQTCVAPYGNCHHQILGTGTTPATANEDLQVAVVQGIGAVPGLTTTGTGCTAALAAGATMMAGTITMTGTTPASSCTFTVTKPAAVQAATTEYTCSGVTDRTSGNTATQSPTVSKTAVTFNALVIAAAADIVTYNGCGYH